MKQHISEKDLLELTEQQKDKLRYIWMPKERDLAVAHICKNAETNEFESIVFTIGKVECEEIEAQGNRSMTKRFSMVLRSLRLIDDDFYEELEKDDIVEDLELDYQSQEDCFCIEETLPLLNIGQMIEILTKHYFLSNSFLIRYNNVEKKYQLSRKISTYNDEIYDHESEELCDALWKAVKTIL